jgi:hypothetical protein
VILPLKWPEVQCPASSDLELWPTYRTNEGIAVSGIEAQLLIRGKQDPTVWGDQLKFCIALVVIGIVRRVYGWSVDWFIPEDPCEIVFRLPWDDLETVEICTDIEQRLHIRLADAELNAAFDRTLGDLVDLIVTSFKEQV